MAGCLLVIAVHAGVRKEDNGPKKFQAELPPCTQNIGATTKKIPDSFCRKLSEGVDTFWKGFYDYTDNRSAATTYEDVGGSPRTYGVRFTYKF